MELAGTASWSEYWPGLLFLLFAGFLVWRGARRRREALVDRHREAASRQGMAYVAPAGEATSDGILQGTHRYAGTTRGVSWVAEVTLLKSEVDDGIVTRQRSTTVLTRWTAPEAGTGGGGLLLMGLPEGVKPPPAGESRGGFLASLAAKAAGAAMQAYVRLHFGHERANSLEISPQDHQPLGDEPLARVFTAFGNGPALLRRLSPAAREWLRDGGRERMAFLWDARGLTLAWPTAPVKPEEIAARAEYGARLVEMLAGQPDASAGH